MYRSAHSDPIEAEIRAAAAAAKKPASARKWMYVLAALVPVAATAAAIAFHSTGLELYLLGFVSGLYTMPLAAAWLNRK